MAECVWAASWVFLSSQSLVSCEDWVNKARVIHTSRRGYNRFPDNVKLILRLTRCLLAIWSRVVRISRYLQCVFFQASSETRLLWACFGRSGVPEGFQVTTRSGANFLLVRNIIKWVLKLFRKMIVPRKNFRMSQLSTFYRMSLKWFHHFFIFLEVKAY